MDFASAHYTNEYRQSLQRKPATLTSLRLIEGFVGDMQEFRSYPEQEILWPQGTPNHP